MPLTKEQQDIIQSIGKQPLVVIAGPGTGKTEILSHGVLYLLNNNLTTKDEIIGIAFTTKAAKQMRERLRELKLEIKKQPLISTLHALSVKIIRDGRDKVVIDENFIVADEYEAFLILNDAISDINPRFFKKGNEILKKIILLKAKRKEPDSISEGLFKKIYERYQKLLQFHSALDFQDLIIQACKILESNGVIRNIYQERSKYLLIDEFQDINEAEYALIKLLASNSGHNLFVVGDDKQSIYSWRGGNPEILLNIQNDFPETIQRPMTKCFRCPVKIIKGADEFIQRVPPLEPQQNNSDPIWVLDCRSDIQEANYISKWIENKIKDGEYQPKDIAVLYRGGDIANKIVEKLANKKIPVIRPSPEETKHLKEFITCLRLIIDRRDSLALRVCLASKLAKGVGNKAIKKLREYAEANCCSFWNALIAAQNDTSFKRWHKPLKTFNRLFESLSATATKTDIKNLLWAVAERLGYKKETRIVEIIKKSETIPNNWSLYDFIQDIRGLKGEKSADPRESAEDRDNAVLFVTTHSVKGLQRKVIFILGMEKGNFPKLNGDIEEQKRLFYVAMTRAKEKLFLCYAKKREGKTARGYTFYDKSPFIYEIPEAYREFIRPS